MNTPGDKTVIRSNNGGGDNDLVSDSLAPLSAQSWNRGNADTAAAVTEESPLRDGDEESSPAAPMSASQPTQEIMTQNAELTQLGDDDDDEVDIFGNLSPLPPTPLEERNQPWGRIIYCDSGASETNDKDENNKTKKKSNNNATSTKSIDLMPKPPLEDKQVGILPSINNFGGISMFGLHGLQAGDIFNEHTVGRSHKADVQTLKPDKALEEGEDDPTVSDEAKTVQCLQEWAHGMISNRHCRIYCSLDNDHLAHNKNNGTRLVATTPIAQEPHVYIEDCSGNGTIINGNTLLRKGEKRRLHSGDEICLVNREKLKRKVRKETMLNKLVQRHSFLFVNLNRNQRPTTRPILQQQQQQQYRYDNNHTNSPVNVRAIKHPSLMNEQQQQKQKQPGLAKRVFGASFQKKVNKQQNVQSHEQQQQQPQPLTFGALNPMRQRAHRFEEDYDLRNELGSGTVGKVYRAIHRQTGKECAVKRIPWNGSAGAHRTIGATDPQNKTHPWQAEAEILQKLNHPYIVDLIDVYITSNALYLVMELMRGGDLFDRVSSRERFSEVTARRLTRRLLSAVHYLHQEKNIVHRDLKPENILMTSLSNDVDIKITDFGLAKTVSEQGLQTFCGTPQYFAPEVLQRHFTVMGRGRYGKPADMWSVGVILYVLLSGTTPFQDITAPADDPQHSGGSNLHKVVFPFEYWHNVSESAIDLIRRLLQPDPRTRFTVTEACKHAWILTEDGDTHTFPLDDPKLPQRTKLSEEVASVSAEQPDPASKKESSSNEPGSIFGLATTSVDKKVDPQKGKVEPAATMKAAEASFHGNSTGHNGTAGGISEPAKSEKSQAKGSQNRHSKAQSKRNNQASCRSTSPKTTQRKSQQEVPRVSGAIGTSTAHIEKDQAPKEGEELPRVSDASENTQQAESTAPDTPAHPRRTPLSPTTVNSRPQEFRKKILEQAASEKLGKKKTKARSSALQVSSPVNKSTARSSQSAVPSRDGQPFDEMDDDIDSQFSDTPESIASFGATSPDAGVEHQLKGAQLFPAVEKNTGGRKKRKKATKTAPNASKKSRKESGKQSTLAKYWGK